MIKAFGLNHIKKEEAILNGVFCPIPWIHFVAYPNGTAQICTHQSDNSICTGNIFNNTFEEILNNRNLRKLRVDMLLGKKNSLCSNCDAFEKANPGKSSRTNYLRKFDHLISDCISKTQDNGFFDPEYFKFAYWNFKISGVCNLKCRTCHPHFSTSIYHEYNRLGWIGENDIFDFVKIKENLAMVMNEILKHTANVEEIHFVGGEPMLMNEHWQILDEMIKCNKLNVRLSYHTNLTTLTFKKKHVFDYWKQFNGEIWLSPSIDAFSEKNVYIRDGSEWGIINENLDKILFLKSELKNLTVVPTITVSVLNVLYLNELVDYFCFKKIDQLNFNIVRVPGFYHVSLLPEYLKKSAVDKLDSCANRNNLDINVFNIIKNELYNKVVPDQKKQLLGIFKEETLKLDTVRKLSFKNVFPELAEMVE